MHLLSKRAHGVLDYLLGVIMVVSPWLFGFSNWTMASCVVILMGCSLIGYSVFTAYELSIAKLIPFNVHLTLDLFSALFLFVCAFWVSFRHPIAWPLLIFAVIEIATVIFTGYESDREPTRHIGGPIGT